MCRVTFASWKNTFLLRGDPPFSQNLIESPQRGLLVQEKREPDDRGALLPPGF